MKTQYVHFSDITVQLGEYVFSLNYVGYDAPGKWNVLAHTHRNYELHVISEGSGILTVGAPMNNIYEISPGSLYLTGPGIVHGQQSGDENLMDEYGLRFDIEYRPAAAADRKDNVLAKNLIEHPFFFVSDPNGSWHTMISELIREAHMQLPGFKQKLTGLFVQFIVELSRLSAEITGNDSDPPQTQAVGGIDIKARLDTYFWGFGGVAPADKIIDDLHITRRSFSRLMQKYYNMSYTEKVNELRIARAKELLISGVPLCEVWQRTGFHSAQYFSRVFKKLTGKTPMSFEKK